MASDIQIKGLEKLKKDLSRLNEKVARKEVQKVLKKGSSIIAKEMRKNAPVGETGRLKKSIADNIKRNDKRVSAARVVGPATRGARKAPHAHLVELGTRGGIYTSSKGFLIYGRDGDRFRTRSIKHPGVRGSFFIERSFTSKGDEASLAIIRAIQAILEKG